MQTRAAVKCTKNIINTTENLKIKIISNLADNTVTIWIWFSVYCTQFVSLTSVAAGSTDTVCPHQPLMTQVQHWAKTIQTDHVTLRPRPFEIMAPVADSGRRHPSVYQVWSS